MGKSLNDIVHVSALQNKINGAIRYIHILSSNIHPIFIFPRFFWLLSFVSADKVCSFFWKMNGWFKQKQIVAFMEVCRMEATKLAGLVNPWLMNNAAQ
jgi:hypothetical protein